MQAESSNAAAAKRATGWDVAPPHSRLVSSTSNYFAAGALSPLCAARRPRGDRRMIMCHMTGAPANPPNALAAALYRQLTLTATPRVFNRNQAGQASVLFTSEADAATALAATSLSLFGSPIRLQRTPSAAATGDAQAERIFISSRSATADRPKGGESTACVGAMETPRHAGGGPLLWAAAAPAGGFLAAGVGAAARRARGASGVKRPRNEDDEVVAATVRPLGRAAAETPTSQSGASAVIS